MLILGRRLFGGSQQALLEQIGGLARGGKPSLLVTLNVDQTLNLQSDALFAKTVGGADLVVIDGTPITWLGKLLGAGQAHRNTGADLLPAVAEAAVDRDWVVAITGGSPTVTELAAAKLAEQHGARVVSVEFPFIDGPEDPTAEQVVEQLNDLQPSVVFLCLGSPKQELWFSQWCDRLPAAVYIGAGAAVDFAAGEVRRAPRLVQRLGLEWFYRLLQEPGRLAHRYLIRGPQFLLVVGRSTLARLKSGQR